ncbi:MAG: DUF3575 domain-containing protein [Bacteroides sp.]|nr:DUF3575 domain-containing protein [Bacteroides sp.]
MIGVASDTTQHPVMGQDEWEEVYRWVASDKQIPNRDEVLMLIRYHYGDFDRLLKLLRYLDGGRPYAYLSQHVFPRISRRGAVREELSMAGIRVPTNVLPVVSPEFGSIVTPALVMEKKEPSPRRVILALKNNILYDLVLAPNLEVEFPIGKRWSLNTEYKCPWWLNNEHGFCYQLLSGGVEVRHWLGNRQKRSRLTGHFLGVYAEGGAYDFQLKEEKGYRGRYYATSGLTYGYTHQLATHVAIEFGLGVGYLETEYRKYSSYKGDLVWNSSGRYHFIGPTKTKVSLVWLITAGR